jgi:hypothetical protein
MEGTEKPRMYKYKEITNDWTYDASYMLTSLPVSDLKSSKCLTFVTQSVPIYSHNDTYISISCYYVHTEKSIHLALLPNENFCT